jgi:3-oxoacyl-[acyl-carrier-protein] synthase II
VIPVISAWSAVSPFGVGRTAFTEGVLAGRTAVAALDPAGYPGPFDRGGLVPGFTAREYLGKKGTRTMDRATAIAVATVGQVIEDAGPALLAEPERVGLVLGTGSGSVQSIMDFTADSLTGDKPYHVDPARFPNTVMNCAAGQSAIWHGLKGPNTTIAGGWLTGLLALSYAVRLWRGGHCPRVLCGAVEEYSVQRAWLESRARDDDGAGSPLGEGASVVLLESPDDAHAAGRTPLATVLATRFRAFGKQAEAGGALAECVRGALDRAGVSASDVRAVAPLGPDGELGALEESGITGVLGDSGYRWLRTRPLLGDTSAAATSFQLAAALAVAAPEVVLVTGVDRDGTTGCCLLGGVS